MADQQGPEGLSKRERQKARREARRREEQARARREQATSRGLRLLAIVAVLALVGWFAGSWIVDWRNDRRLMAEAEENLTALGCDPNTAQPNRGAGHIEDLAALPPSALYQDRPASSGPHIGTVAISGVYDEYIDERLLVHNLEHGYVVVYYDEDAPEEQVSDLKDFVRDRIDSGNPKMIVAPKLGEWSQDKDFAFVAWQARQMCDEFDRGVLLNFLDEHYGLAGVAPEKNVAPHTSAGQGLFDPDAEEGPLLLPPLTAEDPDPAPPAPEPTEGGESDATEGESDPAATPEPTASGEAEAGS